MTLDFGSINILAIIVCHIVYMALGALWYSPILFGNAWMESRGIKPGDIDRKSAMRSMMLSNIPVFISIFILALLLGLTGASTIVDAVIVGSLISVGVVTLFKVNSVLYEDDSIKYFFITIGYPIVGYLVMSIILVIWK